MKVNERDFEVLKLLGKGKGGYSWLVSDGQSQYVLKQIHHEPCDYYQFGDKIRCEYDDYHRLHQVGLRMPALLEIDWEKERILKEYIPGDTIAQLISKGRMKDSYFRQAQAMSSDMCQAGLNIDWFPTNFVVWQDLLYYIDYECNPYDERWSLENWGRAYWSRTEAFIQDVECKAQGFQEIPADL